MKPNFFVISEKDMYSNAIQMLLEELHKTSQIVSHLVELKEELTQSKGSIIIIGPTIHKSPYDICQEISRMYPTTAVLLLLQEKDLDLKKALYSGAADIVDIDSEEEEIIASINKVEEVVQQKVKGEKTAKGIVNEGKVITVCSTKGGVGKTTISANLAVAYNKQNLKVIVLDLDLQFGDVALLFDLQPARTLYDWVKQSYENGDKSYDRFLLKHKSGIDILAAPSLPEFAELVKGEHIAYLTEEFRKEYDIIIVDTPPAFVETSLVALEASDLILLIAAYDLPALKNGKLAIETLSLLGLNEKIHVIVNRDGPADGMSPELVEKVLGRKIEGSIPSDYHTVIASINKGESFVITDPRTPVAKAMMQLSEQLLMQEASDLSRKKDTKRKGFSLFRRK
jgi:pilus assembly protein CpaE